MDGYQTWLGVFHIRLKEKMREFKIDLHVHTDASFDGRSSLAEVVKSAKSKGLDAILISDHNVFSLEKSQFIDGLYVMSGCEISTTAGHMLALFSDFGFDVTSLPTWNGVLDAKVAVDTIHKYNGLAIMAHPYQNKNRNIDFLAEHLDGVECANARVYMKNANGNAMACRFAQTHGLIRTGGSDAHHKDEIGNCYTVVKANSIEEIESAIRQGNCSEVEHLRTKRYKKGLSQMTKAMRSRKLKNYIKAFLVLGKGILFDFLEAVGLYH